MSKKPLHTSRKHRAELLMPAGSLEKMKTAIMYGADAVYCGTPDLSLRSKSQFNLDELLEGIEYAHQQGKRVYLTLNLYTHTKDVKKLPHFIKTIKKVKPDGVIIADPGVFEYVKTHAPEIPLHVSTQANVLSHLTVKFWQNQGAELVVLGREVNFAELKEIREACRDIKLEAFVHGSMCMAHSGRCIISNFLAERGANQGSCAHSCRWNYKMHIKLKDGTLQELQINDQNRELFEFLVEEEFRPGELLPIIENEAGSYLFNAKDLCLMPKLNQYLELGIDSLKVEGRNKTNYYAAIVTKAYRQAIDDYYRDPENWKPDIYMELLNSLQNRGYTLAFHEGRLSNLAHNYLSGASTSEYEYAGVIRQWRDNELIFEVKNTIESGDAIEFISPANEKPVRVRFQQFQDAHNPEIITEKVSPGQNKAIVIKKEIFQSLPTSQVKKILPPFTIARKKKFLTEEDRMRLLIDLESYKAEVSGLRLSEEHRAKLLEFARERELRIRNSEIKPKGPKFGLEACCKKGCNGCLIFWNQPKTARLDKTAIKAFN